MQVFFVELGVEAFHSGAVSLICNKTFFLSIRKIEKEEKAREGNSDRWMYKRDRFSKWPTWNTRGQSYNLVHFAQYWIEISCYKLKENMQVRTDKSRMILKASNT